MMMLCTPADQTQLAFCTRATTAPGLSWRAQEVIHYETVWNYVYVKSVKLWHCLVPSCWQIHFSLWVMGSRIRGTKRLSLLVHLTSETYFFNLICCSLSLARNKLKFSVGSTVFSNVILCPSSVITSSLYCLPINFFGSRSTSFM